MFAETDNEQEFLTRIQKIERSVFGETLENNYRKRGINRTSAREQMRENARRENRGQERKFIGKKSYQVLKQELLSMSNTKPAYRDEKWVRRMKELRYDASDLKMEHNQIVNLAKILRQIGGATGY